MRLEKDVGPIIVPETILGKIAVLKAGGVPCMTGFMFYTYNG